MAVQVRLGEPDFKGLRVYAGLFLFFPGLAGQEHGRNLFQTLPVALRENGGFILYMCPQISHSYSEKEPFFIIRHGVPERSEFTPPDFETALRRLYDVETGNVPGFAPNAIQA